MSARATITPELCVGGRELSEPRLNRHGSFVVYGSSVAGVACLVVHSLADDAPDRLLATEPALRPARGLGGGGWCFTADESAVVYVAIDGDLWLQPIDSAAARQLTVLQGERSVSSPHCAPGGRWVVFALDQAGIWQLTFDGNALHRVDDGSADFCLDPFVDPDSGTIRWQAWNVPDMPWDGSRIQRRVGDGVVLDEKGAGCIQQSRVLPTGEPVSVRDDDGWLNVWGGEGADARPIVAEPFEHAGPTWGPGQRSFAWSPTGDRIAFTRNDRGFGQLCVVDTDGGKAPTKVADGVHGQLSWAGGRLAALRSDARTPPTIVVYDTETWNDTETWRDTVVVASADWASIDLVDPEPVAIDTDEGIVPARLYPGSGRGLLVWLHGGPTDQWQVSFMARVAYWRAQGWSILVPDHRGSTGHGRAYQQALRGRWGVVDVADTVAAAGHAHSMGWGAPQNTVVMGGSSGGFTALGALAAAPGLFAAAVVLYPVTDLIDLAARSHRFELHYTDSLIGPLPAAIDAYRDRSPIEHAGRYVATPILILHGDTDPVVPVEHSQAFAARVRAAGGDVELNVYEGEGHGFRQRVNQLDEYSRIAGFLARHVPLASAR